MAISLGDSRAFCGRRQAMEMEAEAERRRRAEVLQSEGDRQSEVNLAQGPGMVSRC